MTERLRDALRTQAVTLSQRVLDTMYENPFWTERFGERGRRFADEDSLHHVNYLDQALAAGDPAVFTRYARWLRTVLVSRGMCSEHLAENYRLLSEAIAEAGLPDAPAAGAILSSGAAALAYDEGPAGALQAKWQALRDAVDAAQDPAAPMREDDRRYLISYLLDAVATAERTHFEGFARRCPAAVAGALLRTSAPSAR